MADWTFTERVDLFLELAAEIDGLRLTNTRIDLGAHFHWAEGQDLSAELPPIDTDDFRSFVVAWRQLVTRAEPTHLRTVLALCTDHLTDPELRGRARFVLDRVDQVNRNDLPTERPRFALLAGEREYSPWEVADLLMHGAVFHRRDRTKKAILDVMPPAWRSFLEFIFRMYIVDITQAMDVTRWILLKAKEGNALSDAPI